MAKTFEYEPHNGMWTIMEDDPHSGGVYIHRRQNVTPILDYAARERNSGMNDKVGNFNRYAIIPTHVELELKQKGINIYDKNCTSRLIKEIETNYPHLKCTNLKHSVRA